MTKIITTFGRVAMGGGGKIRSMQHRLNAFSQIPGYESILLNLKHNIKNKEDFLRLQANGFIFKEVRYLSLPEAASEDDATKHLPIFDPAIELGKFDKKEKNKKTEAGDIKTLTVDKGGNRLTYTFVNDQIFKSVATKPDGTRITTDYARSRAVREIETKGESYVRGKNLITNKTYRMEKALSKSLYHLIPWQPALHFFDGINLAYLSTAATPPRALFLHADHRQLDSTVLERPKFNIENFTGEAIITATNTHKAQLNIDLDLSIKIHVIPHFCDITPTEKKDRKNLVTISRLDLIGKPIHECIEAFALIKDDFPNVDYDIFGSGSGRDILEDLIHKLDIADRVNLKGYTNNPLDVFRNAIASIYPTITEGFGLSILEALSCGCPVLSYDVNYGPREMITRGKNGELPPPGDINAIASAMRNILNSPERYQRNTGYLLSRYTRSSYINNHKELADELLLNYSTRAST